MHQILICLFTFDVQFFCLSAAQNGPPAGCQPARGKFCAADKQENCASKVNKLTFGYKANFQETAREVKG
jgi:hypothetical protein